MKHLVRTCCVMCLLAIVLILITGGIMRSYAAAPAAFFTPATAVSAVVAANPDMNVVVASASRPLEAGIVNVVVSGPLDIELKQGAAPALLIKGEASMLPRVTVRVEGTTLYLGTRGIVMLIRQPLRLELSLPALEKLQMQGSGNAQLYGFSGKRLELTTRGSGDVSGQIRYQQVQAGSGGSGNLNLVLGQADSIELSVQGSGNALLSGQASLLHVNVLGSGDVDTRKLKADQVNINASGSGDVTVFAAQNLKLRLAGSGEVTVYGNPATRNVERMGSGDVHWQ